MSISPATDLILDVARAADPVRLRAAAARLDAAPAPTDGVFAATLAAEQAAPAPTPTVVPPSAPQVDATPAPAKGPLQAAAPAAYRDFEAMVLANLLQSVMPDDDTMFGSGTSASVWKGVFVQEVGKAVAARGGIGIAAALARDADLRPNAATTATAVASTALVANLADQARQMTVQSLDTLGGTK